MLIETTNYAAKMVVAVLLALTRAWKTRSSKRKRKKMMMRMRMKREAPRTCYG